jgi:hypothetical protein
MRKCSLALLALAALLTATAATAQDAVLINDQSGGLIELTDERLLVISGLQGHISLRLGRSGEMQYGARLLSNRRDERQVALLAAGNRLMLEPIQGRETERILLEVVVPPELDIEVELADSILSLSGLMSDVHGKAVQSDLNASILRGSLDLELTGGKAKIGACEEEIRLTLRQMEADLSQLKGPLTIDASDSMVEIAVLQSSLDLTLERTELVAKNVQGKAAATARGGQLQLQSFRQGIDLKLSECQLRMSDIEGGARIESDALIRFEDLKSDLFVTGYGAGLIGSGSVGGVEVTTDMARVALENITGPVVVEGQELEVHLKDLKAETRVKTVMSEMLIENSTAPLDIESEFGDIGIVKAADAVKIRSTDGDVRISDLSAHLDLKAKGYMVEVSWSEFPSEENSTIVNEDGGLQLLFPQAGRCRLEAESGSGKIESELQDIRITNDGRFASGLLGGGDKPVIQATAKEDILIGVSRPSGS